MTSSVKNLCLNETNLMHYSYDWCKENDVCEMNWFLSFNDREHFEYLFQKFMDEINVKDYFFSISCKIDDEIHLKHLWLTIMKLHKFCPPNQVFEIGIGCRCLPGKQCDELKSDAFAFQQTSLNILVLLVGILIFYGGSVMLHHLHLIIKEKYISYTPSESITVSSENEFDLFQEEE